MSIRFSPIVLMLFGLGTIATVACSSEESRPPGIPFNPAAQQRESTDTSLHFKAPADWNSESPASSMRLAQYRLPRAQNDPEDAELVVYHFGGGGGSVQANVNRWIGQFTNADGSSAKESADVSERDSNGFHLTVVDVRGTYNQPRGPMMAETDAKASFRMMAVVAEAQGGPWFFKLTGPENTVSQWEGSFNSFLETLRVE